MALAMTTMALALAITIMAPDLAMTTMALALAIITMALDLAMTTMALAMTTMALETMERFGVVDTQPKAVQLAPRDTVRLGAMETVPGQMTSASKVASVVVATKPAPAQSVPRDLVKPGAMETVPGKMTSASQQISSETTMALGTTMALAQTTMETTMALDTTMALVQITTETTLGTVQITRSNTYVRCTCTFDYDYLGLTDS